MPVRLHAILFGGIAILVPLTVYAADWNVAGDDTIAGFGTSITVEGEGSTDATVVLTPPEGRDVRYEVSTNSNGMADAEIRERDTELAGVYSVILEDGDGGELARTTFEVFPDALAVEESSFTVDSETALQGEEVEGIVSLSDAFGNPLASRPVSVTSDRQEDVIEIVDEESAENGEVHFFFSSAMSGEATLIAMDLLSGEVLGRQAVTVEKKKKSGGALQARLIDEYDNGEDPGNEEEAGMATFFDIQVPESIVRVNDPVDITIVARDKDERKAEGYVGKVVLETSDPDAQFPLDAISFFPSDRGAKSLSLSLIFGTPGSQTIKAFDRDEPSIEGEVQLRVVGTSQPLTEEEITIMTPKDGATISSSPLTVTGSAPVLVNLELWDNDVWIESGESGNEGHFSFTADIDLTVPKHTFVVKEGEGGLDRKSTPVVVLVDIDAPKIESVSITPDKVEPGQSVELRVTAEEGEAVRAFLEGGAAFPMGIDGEPVNAKVTYKGTFTAPAKPGMYKVFVAIRDKAGNEVEQWKVVNVEDVAMPVVQSVSASVDGADVHLTWDPVEGAVAYRIYYGPSVENFTRNVDTPSVASSARITGLQPGQEQFFAVTAIDSKGRESGEKSTPVRATPRGSLFDVQITSTVNGASMQWKHMPGTSVSGYKIRYGVEAGVYSEQRLLPGDRTYFDFHDLINGVIYSVSLSAQLRDGTELRDTMEQSFTPGIQGQPGFHPVAPDPVPADIGGFTVIEYPVAPETGTPPPEPQFRTVEARPSIVHASGFPIEALFAILTLVGGYAGVTMVKRQRMKREILLSILRHSQPS